MCLIKFNWLVKLLAWLLSDYQIKKQKPGSNPWGLNGEQDTMNEWRSCRFSSSLSNKHMTLKSLAWSGFRGLLPIHFCRDLWEIWWEIKNWFLWSWLFAGCWNHRDKTIWWQFKLFMLPYLKTHDFGSWYEGAYATHGSAINITAPEIKWRKTLWKGSIQFINHSC